MSSQNWKPWYNTTGAAPSSAALSGAVPKSSASPVTLAASACLHPKPDNQQIVRSGPRVAFSKAEEKPKFQSNLASFYSKIDHQQTPPASQTSSYYKVDCHQQPPLTQMTRNPAEAKKSQALAALYVRKVIQRVRQPDLTNFEQLCVELEHAQLEKAQDLGPLAETIREEAGRAIAQGRLKIEKLQQEEFEKERKRQELEVRRQERLAEIEAKRRVEEQRIAKLWGSCEEAVMIVELCATKVSENARSVALGTPQEMMAAVSGLEESVVEANDALNAAAKLLPERRKELGKDAKEEAFAKWNGILQKVQAEMVKQKAELPLARERAARRMAAQRREDAWKTVFARHDSDKDGRLSKAEIRAFAKAQHDLELGNVFLDKLIKKCATGGKGVPFEQFRIVRALVAIEQSAAQERQRKAESEEAERTRKEEDTQRAAEMVALKEEVNQSVAEVKEMLTEVRDAIAKASKAGSRLQLVEKAKTLAQNGLHATLPVQSTKEIAVEILREADAARASLSRIETSISERVAAASNHPNEELSAYTKAAFAPDIKRIAALWDQTTKAVETARVAQARVLRAECAVIEPLRHAVALCVTQILNTEEGTSAENLFQTSAKSASSGLTHEEFVMFLRSLRESLPSDAVGHEPLWADALDANVTEALFRTIAGRDKETLTLDRFVQSLISAYFRVHKPTILTQEELVDSKRLGRLEERQLLRALSCATFHSETGVTRLKCRVVTSEGSGVDGPQGWATISGSRGTTFMVPWSKFVACTKDTIMSTELESTSTVVRKVQSAEVLEIIDLDQKDSNGIVRVRCMALSDNAVGWVNLASNTGVVFLESC